MYVLRERLVDLLHSQFCMFELAFEVLLDNNATCTSMPLRGTEVGYFVIQVKDLLTCFFFT